MSTVTEKSLDEQIKELFARAKAAGQEADEILGNFDIDPQVALVKAKELRLLKVQLFAEALDLRERSSR